MRHELNARQQEQIAAMERGIEALKAQAAAYVQAIVDGIPGSAEHQWRRDGAYLVAIEPKMS